MTNKIFFTIKYKMLKAYGFHINFQFRNQKSFPGDLQMALASPWQRTGLASWILDFLARIFFRGNLYVYTHMQKHAVFTYHLNFFQKTRLLYTG